MRTARRKAPSRYKSTFDIGERFADIRRIRLMNPQRGTHDGQLPPRVAGVNSRDQAFIHVTFLPAIQKEDSWRGAAGRNDNDTGI